MKSVIVLLHLKLAVTQTGDLILVSSQKPYSALGMGMGTPGRSSPRVGAHGIVCALGHNLAECSAV